MEGGKIKRHDGENDLLTFYPVHKTIPHHFQQLHTFHSSSFC